MSGDCAETISSGKAFQCLITSMKNDDLCAWVGTNGVNSWMEFGLLGDGCGWGVKTVVDDIGPVNSDFGTVVIASITAPPSDLESR